MELDWVASFFYRAALLVERGEYTREQALIALALALDDLATHQQKTILDLLNTRIVSPIVWPK